MLFASLLLQGYDVDNINVNNIVFFIANFFIINV